MTKNQGSSTASFEQCLERIQIVVAKLESGNLSLEQSLALFEEGIGLVRRCQQQLQQAEYKVEMLLSDGGNKLVHQPFLLTEDDTK